MDPRKPYRYCPRCGTALDPAAPACAWCAGARRRKQRPLLIAGGIAAVLGAGALLLPGAPGMGLLQQGGFGRHETAQVGAPVTTAPDPAAPAPNQPLIAARPAKPKHGQPVTSAPGQPEALAPSVLLGAESTKPESKGPSVIAAPARPDTPVAPAAPPMISAPAAPAPPPGGNLLATREAAPPPSQGTLLENGWLERPSEQQNPEIIIHNDASRSAVLLVRGRNKTYRWIIGPRGLRETLLPGTYRYELQEEIYEKTGRPDQVGSLSCGQYKAYELTYWHRSGGYTHVEDIGDEAR